MTEGSGFPYATAATWRTIGDDLQTLLGSSPLTCSGSGKSVERINEKLARVSTWGARMAQTFYDAAELCDPQDAEDVHLIASPNHKDVERLAEEMKTAKASGDVDAYRQARTEHDDAKQQWEDKRQKHGDYTEGTCTALDALEMPELPGVEGGGILTPRLAGGDQQVDCQPYEPQTAEQGDVTPSGEQSTPAAQPSTAAASGSGAGSTVSADQAGTSLTASAAPSMPTAPTLGTPTPPVMQPMSAAQVGGGSTTAPTASLPPSWTAPNAYRGTSLGAPTGSADAARNNRRRPDQHMPEMGALSAHVGMNGGVDRGVSVRDVNLPQGTTDSKGTQLSGAGTNQQGGSANPNQGGSQARGGGYMGGPMGYMGSGAQGTTKDRPAIKPLVKDPALHGSESVQQGVNGGMVSRDSATVPDEAGLDRFLDPGKLNIDPDKKKGDVA